MKSKKSFKIGDKVTFKVNGEIWDGLIYCKINDKSYKIISPNMLNMILIVSVDNITLSTD